jgi:hypothetical protein
MIPVLQWTADISVRSLREQRIYEIIWKQGDCSAGAIWKNA